MPTIHQPLNDDALQAKTFNIAIRLGVFGLLVVWCFQIVKPFITTITWGIIIAVATRPLQRRLQAALGGRPKLSSVLVTVLLLITLMVPTVLLSSTLIESFEKGTLHFESGTFRVPPPPEKISAWPAIGEPLYTFWSLASTNLEAALKKMAPQLKALGKWLLSTAAGAGAWAIQFVIAIIVAGVLLANADGGHHVAQVIAARLKGEQGPELVALAGATVQSVARGILGVAVIQAILSGIGMAVVGVPGAGLWALMVLITAVIQLPTLLILGPVMLYVFSTASTFTAVAFMIWALFAGSCDTFLKPILLGRGAQVPMLVIFIGAIGGFMGSGIIGLFVGAIVLSLGYRLFIAWFDEKLEILPDACRVEADTEEAEGGEPS